MNSSWTEDHINRLWCGHTEDKKNSVSKNTHRQVFKVYPPCDVTDFTRIPRRTHERSDVRIVSVGQFRPEKDHALQIRTMFELRQILEESVWERVKLVLIGGVRNAEDEKRVKDLKDLCAHLSIEDKIEFLTNIPFDELKDEMSFATMGIHTMWNEHFGIGKS